MAQAINREIRIVRLVPLTLAALLALAPQQLTAKPRSTGGHPAVRPVAHPAAVAQTIDLAKALIALRSVQGPGNQTPAALAMVKAALVKAGWQDSQVQVTPFNDTAFLVATWPGSDPSLKPLVISGHMDVVEAKPADWQRDPFTPIVENGYLFGRGASDMKFDAALATSSLIELRR